MREEIATAVALNANGNHVEAAAHAFMLLEGAPNSAELLSLAGNASFAAGDYAKAAAAFARLTVLKPNVAVEHYNLGISLHMGGSIGQAVTEYGKAIAIDPGLAKAHNNLGSCLFVLERHEDAVEVYRRAIALEPGYFAAFGNLGTALAKLRRDEEALAAFHAALHLNPGLASAHYNLGNLYMAQRRLDLAIGAFQSALAAESGYFDAQNMLGVALYAAGDAVGAEAAYRQALLLNPDHSGVHNNLGIQLLDTKRLDEAAKHLRTACQLDPLRHEVRSLELHTRAQMCDWTAFADFTRDKNMLGLAADASPAEPFALLPFDDDPQRQLQRAERYAQTTFAHTRAHGGPVVRSVPARLRIGYFSSDFHNHATMMLLAGVFREHDRAAFEIHIYSYGSRHDKDVDDALARHADQVFDIHGVGDQAAADLARENGVDIAIDLKGYTGDSRPELFGFRPAPVQIAWLGYPGTLGACPIDYVIGDHIVTPHGEELNYGEAIIRLPGSYQPNDCLRKISARLFTRQELGLPEQGFVFACLNTNSKISPAEFDIWMRLLMQTDGSVLWLLRSNDWAEANLRREAQARGIDPERLVFAEFAPVDEHLARQRHADLFLDTFAYNAHTTASDALWAGLPVLTLPGKSFAARVAASLLYAAGLPELVAASAEEYEQVALALASDPERLAAIRGKLAANRETCALFNTPRFTRHLEAAYREAYRRFASGEGAASFDVAAI